MSEFSEFLFRKYKDKYKDKKISVRSLAKKIGMSHNYLGQLLRGKVNAPEGIIQKKIANELIPINERQYFYDLAAKDRKDIPIDMMEEIAKQNDKWNKIRNIL
jgi:transcriptional regulator with XRE-family HTH domain